MEYVEGVSLADEIRKGALPLGTAIDIGRQLASAVNAAHTLGVVHRDLKPANVQLSSDGRVKVLDFGLARAAVPKAGGVSTSSRAFADGKPLLFGTPGYMSPEHWQKTTVSEAADIYCIGLIMYELVTGRGPEASGEPLDQLLYTGELPSRPDALNPSAPAALAAIVERALQPSPERRWQSAAELETALTRILHAVPGSERSKIQPLSLEFAVTLSRQDWEPLDGAWQCPALGIPTADVVALRPGGVAVNTKSFEVVRDRRLIKWQGGEKTREAVAVIRVAGDLATSNANRFWKRLAMGIAAASLLAITLLFAFYARHARTDAERAHNAIVETFARSNDFLTTGPDYSFARLLGDTQREAWFIGTTFYISVDQFHDMLLERLQKGIDLHFLILSPDAENVRRVAALLGVTEEELLPQCLAGIRTLRRLDEEAHASKAPGVPRVPADQRAASVTYVLVRSAIGARIHVLCSADQRRQLASAAGLPGREQRRTLSSRVLRGRDAHLEWPDSPRLVGMASGESESPAKSH